MSTRETFFQQAQHQDIGTFLLKFPFYILPGRIISDFLQKGWNHSLPTSLADRLHWGPADFRINPDNETGRDWPRNVEVDEDAIEERMEGAALDPDVTSAWGTVGPGVCCTCRINECVVDWDIWDWGGYTLPVNSNLVWVWCRSGGRLWDNIFHGGFPKWGYPSSWMVYFMENHIKTDDLGVPPFQETSI